MKQFKKSLALSLAILCAIFSFDVTSFASTTDPTQMNELDILLTANSVLNTDTEDYWSYSGKNCYDLVPLYNSNDDLVAYYIHLDNGGYAVINNNTENPAVIEFGVSDNPIIREILNANPVAHIIYNDPFSIYDANKNPFSINLNCKDIYENYPDLKSPNPTLSNLLKAQKEIASTTISPFGDGDYGFIDWDNMPSGSYTSDNLTSISNITFVTTGETAQFVSGTPNHCGCVAVANLALYFQYIGKIENSATPLGAFLWAYPFVGNGPKMTIAPEAKEFFYDWNCSILNYKTGITLAGPMSRKSTN